MPKISKYLMVKNKLKKEKKKENEVFVCFVLLGIHTCKCSTALNSKLK